MQRIVATLLVVGVLAIPVYAQPENGGTTPSVFTPAEEISVTTKLSSDLIDLARRARTGTLHRDDKSEDRIQSDNGLEAMSLSTDSDGRIHVYIYPHPGFSSSEIVEAIEGLGCIPVAVGNGVGMIQALVHADQLPAVSSLSSIRLITPVYDPVPRRGAVNTQGDSRMRSDVARTLFNATGNGIRVGVLSDDCGSQDGDDGAVDGNSLLSVRIGNDPNVHELGAGTTVVDDGFAGTRSHEGLAMMEIVQDVAPNAAIYFARGFGGQMVMAQNINALRANGCRIIVDDVGYTDEPVFEESGPIVDAINNVTAFGSLYVTAAGNDALENYRATYVNRANQPIGNLGGLHDVMDFNGAGDILQSFTIPAATLANPVRVVRITLHWDDKYGASNNNFDLYVVDNANTVVIASSTTVQNGAQNPFETVNVQNTNAAPVSGQIIVRRTAVAGANPNATPRLRIAAYGASAFEYSSAAQSIYGHVMPVNAFAVGAIDATVNNYNTIRNFSSQGPVDVIDFTSNVRPRPISVTRTKPDIASFDGVATTVAGFNPFPGTSAAAPHAAGLAALLLQLRPTMTPAQLRDAITFGGVDYGIANKDNVFGFGRTDGYTSMAAMLFAPGPNTLFAKSPVPGSDVPIPDNNPAGGVSTIVLNVPPYVAADTVLLSVTIDGHNHYGDLRMFLTSPDGTSRRVLNRPVNTAGGAGGNNPNLVFSDIATTAIQTHDPGNQEILGLFRPQELISFTLGFKHRMVNGNWTLKVVDAAGGDAGIIKTWNLAIKQGVAPIAKFDFDGGTNPNPSTISFGAPGNETAVDITFPSITTGGRFSVALMAGQPKDPNGIATANISQYRWLMEPLHDFAFTGNATVAFNASQIPSSGINHPANVKVFHRPDEDVGVFSELATTVVDPVISVMTPTFSEWAFGSADQQLPVELAEFSANAHGRQVLLSWRTASEVGNAGFEVQRAALRDSDFVTIASYLGDARLTGLGTSSIGRRYSYADGGDGALKAGWTYLYRLVDVAIDGVRTVHPVRSVRIDDQGMDAALLPTFRIEPVHPNPVDASMRLVFSSSESQQVSVQIYSGDGRLVGTPMLPQYYPAGIHEIDIATAELSPGMYVLKVSTHDRVRIQRLIVAR